MPLIKILTNSIGTGIRKVLGQGNDLLIGPNATVTSTDGTTIEALFSNQTVTVKGTVTSPFLYAIVMGDAPGDTGMAVRVDKSGVVIGDNAAIQVNGRTADILNNGLIAGYGGIELNVDGPGRTTVRNAGTISVGNFGIEVNGSQNILLINTGQILAPGNNAIDLGGGNDRVVNTGFVSGDIILNDGNDAYLGRGGVVTTSIYGGSGNDRFMPGAGREVINGDGDTDTLDFRQGPGVKVALDGAFVGAGAAKHDLYFGIENVLGSQKADTIRGDINNNLLNGFGGADRIIALAGQDTLIGGSGIDVMSGGGPGPDFFRYAVAADGRDKITDFSSNDGLGDDDAFEISAAGFKGGLSAGVLGASQFKSGGNNQAGDGNDRFIFRTGDETLWFDRDGTGNAFAPVLIADLQNGATMTHLDIIIF